MFITKTNPRYKDIADNSGFISLVWIAVHFIHLKQKYREIWLDRMPCCSFLSHTTSDERINNLPSIGFTYYVCFISSLVLGSLCSQSNLLGLTTVGKLCLLWQVRNHSVAGLHQALCRLSTSSPLFSIQGVHYKLLQTIHDKNKHLHIRQVRQHSTDQRKKASSALAHPQQPLYFLYCLLERTNF